METETRKLTDRERRDMAVAIARDVIDQIRDLDRPLKIQNGRGYVSGSLGIEIDMGLDLKDYVDLVQEKCYVCMLGGCMLSKARLYDEVPLAGIIDSPVTGSLTVDRFDTEWSLMQAFGEANIDLLECAFECKPRMSKFDTPADLRIGAMAFGCGYSDPKSRALAIMENVVANDGDFVVVPLDEFQDWSVSELSWEDTDDDDHGADDFDDDDEDS